MIRKRWSALTARRSGRFCLRRRRISLSRRGVAYPYYRVTRSTTWSDEINPWTDKDRLPLFAGGLLARLIYAGMPEVIDELAWDEEDPAAEYLSGMRSLLAIPMYDQGESLNMVVVLGYQPSAFIKEEIPEIVWRSNLFGRATGNLVLKEELQRAYEALDRELKIVSDIQLSLLPAELPRIPTLDLATYYRPSHRAGGDYYDFFPLPDGEWGIFVGDVSGHGTPAAVLMAVTHCLAHTCPGPPAPPGKILAYLNDHLVSGYTSLNDSFVTAFYAIYDPATRRPDLFCAGHNPPRLKRCQDGTLMILDQCNNPPLGIVPGVIYEEFGASLAKRRPGRLLYRWNHGGPQSGKRTVRERAAGSMSLSNAAWGPRPCWIPFCARYRNLPPGGQSSTIRL